MGNYSCPSSPRPGPIPPGKKKRRTSSFVKKMLKKKRKTDFETKVYCRESKEMIRP
jgi:hypothetical protein